MDKSIIDSLLAKSGVSPITCTIDELIEKAVYGAGASHGKVERGSGKDSSKPGKVTTPALSEERKKQIIEGGRKKAEDQASSTGLHATAARIRAEKSLDDRTTDLVKSLNVDYGRRKAGSRPGGYRQDPDAGIDRKKEERMDAEGVGTREGPEDKGKYVPGSKTFNNPQDSQDPKIRYKSLDERTCDLHKGFAPEKVGGAVGREYVKNPDSEKAKRVAVKFHTKNNNPESQEKFGEGMTNEIWNHNLKLAKKSQQDIVNTWQTDSSFITKGSRVMPLGPGGEVQDLSKDGQRPPGRTPTYQQTDEKQRDVDSGKIERERKAKKRIADLGAE